MGAYMSAPNKEKVSEDGSGPSYSYGASSMQGWRTGMEDAHVAKTDVAGGIGMFAVFDGHGGKEVANFCAKYMPSEFAALAKKTHSINDQTLRDAFHKMDSMLREEKYAEELAILSGKYDDGNSSPSPPAAGSPTASGGPLRAPSSKERAAQMVRTSLNASLDDAKRKGKLTKKEATDLLVKMMALQRMESKAESSVAAGGAAAARAVGEDDENHNTSAGCTAIVAVLDGRNLWVANAGDSRAVLCSRGRAVELSHDHKPNLPEERQRIEAAGGFVADAANGHFRVNGNLNLSRSIGDLKYKGNARRPREQQVITAEPDVRKHVVMPGDEFLVLACDGVYDVLSNQELVDFIRTRLGRGMKLSTICEEVFEQCISPDPKGSSGIGGDNMTCLIVRFASA